MGSIVELKDKLYILVELVCNREDSGSCAYDRQYRLYPYDSDMSDDITVDKRDTLLHDEKGVNMEMTFRDDKIPYRMYGESTVRGITTYMFERVYSDPVIIPTK